uniref:DUF3741 domain-containing protein n=1 Tax=Kalanchoe fedtschenkoi TaxID=63787 RepID=A0A7N0T8R2_KALFE
MRTFRLFCLLLPAIPRETQSINSIVNFWEETKITNNIPPLPVLLSVGRHSEKLLCHRQDLKTGRRMSAKLMYSLTDDKKGVKSQMGCMNGLFQLFDRHHFMGGRRIRLPPPGECQQTEVENASCKAKAHMKDTSKSMLQGDNLRHDPKDRHGISSDSISSSTCSSVFTSNKSAIQQTTSTTPSISQEAPSRTILHTQSAESPNLNQPSGIVKENGNREVPGLTVKTPAVKGIRCAVKLIDSPRPSAPSAPITPKFTGLDESFKKLRKFQDIRSGHSEGPLITRNEVHRFSCDGRVTHSQDTLKSALKLKEKPRLSLDSRASSARMFTPKSEAHCSPKRSEKDNLMSPKVEQEAESCKHTSIVAKLMGLENTSGFRFRGNSNESSEPSNADKNTPQILPFSFKDSTANYGNEPRTSAPGSMLISSQIKTLSVDSNSHK